MSIGEKLLGIVARHTVLILLAGLVVVFAVNTPERFSLRENTSNVARQISFDAIIAFGEAVVLITGASTCPSGISPRCRRP